MHINLFSYTYIHIYKYTHTLIRIYIHRYMYVHTYIYTYALFPLLRSQVSALNPMAPTHPHAYTLTQPHTHTQISTHSVMGTRANTLNLMLHTNPPTHPWTHTPLRNLSSAPNSLPSTQSDATLGWVYIYTHVYIYICI